MVLNLYPESAMGSGCPQTSGSQRHIPVKEAGAGVSKAAFSLSTPVAGSSSNGSTEFQGTPRLGLIARHHVAASGLGSR